MATVITVTTGIILIPVQEFLLESIHQATIDTPGILRDIIIPQVIIVHPLDFMVAGFGPGLVST